MATNSVIYSTLLLGQLTFYTVALLGGVGEGFGFRLRAFAVPYYFCLVNFAAMVAFFRALSGKAQAIRTPIMYYDSGTTE